MGNDNRAVQEEIDVLGRDGTVRAIRTVVHSVSNNKRGMVFSIEANWGTGKSYVLRHLEDSLRAEMEENGTKKYHIFHYDCWKYDYYEEPLVAILSAMIEQSRTIQDTAVGGMKETGKVLLKTLCSALGEIAKNKIGFDIVGGVKDVIDGNMQRKEEETEYDSFKDVRNMLDAVRDKIKDIAETKTVILVVDELDRCLPDYAIKVLERLHHLFDGLDNFIVIIGVNREHLEHTIRQIFGENCDTDGYLRKFINFKYVLTEGKLSMDFFRNYDEYFSSFPMDKISERAKGELLTMMSISGQNIRTLEKLVGTAKMIHSICFAPGLTAPEVMFFEMIWAVCTNTLILKHVPRNRLRSVWEYVVDPNSNPLPAGCQSERDVANLFGMELYQWLRTMDRRDALRNVWEYLDIIVCDANNNSGYPERYIRGCNFFSMMAMQMM